MFCESSGNGNVERLNSIWRVTDNDLRSKDGGQVCDFFLLVPSVLGIEIFEKEGYAARYFHK